VIGEIEDSIVAHLFTRDGAGTARKSRFAVFSDTCGEGFYDDFGLTLFILRKNLIESLWTL